MLQVDRIVIGSISLIGETYTITGRIVDVESGKTVRITDRVSKGSIDLIVSTVILEVGNELIYPRGKSRTKWYIIGGAVVIGIAAAYLIIQDKGEGPQKSTITTGTLILNVPDRPDEPLK